jgi:hypothetical protein
MKPPKPRWPRRRIDPAWVPDIKRRILQGELQDRIAAHYDVNQGRISEINTGRLFPEIKPAS